MRCDVLAVGTELLLGQIVDTNSAWLGEQLAAGGIDSLVQVKVGDNVGRIVAQLRRLLDDADALIVCGGLGPTHDDLTREAIAAVMGSGCTTTRPSPMSSARCSSVGPADGREQPASGAGSGRRDDHPADARDRAGSDLPGDRRRRRQGDVRGPGRAARDAGDVRTGDPPRAPAAQRRPVGDREPRAAHVG